MANIKDIADFAGVSIATVSRALSNPALVKADTQRRIEEAIDKLKYRPNMLAARLRRQCSNNVIVAVPDIFNPFTSVFVQGIENLAREAGYRVLLAITQSDQTLLDSYVDMIAGKEADGMIVLDVIQPGFVSRVANDLRVPIVAACEYPAEIGVPRVRIDDVEAMAAMVGHLVKLGHTRIAAIAGPLDLSISRDRLIGFRLGLRRAGLDPEQATVVYGDFSLASGDAATKGLLAAGHGFTALCCGNDEMAIGALARLRQMGIDVPGDVSVSGFANLRFGDFACPPLTTIDIRTQETGETAMQLMIDMLQHPNETPREVILSHELIVRQSTAPPPSATRSG